MPRQSSAVKPKLPFVSTPGAVDLHFHGAFGIDLMSATPQELDRLSLLLFQHGIHAFCPTTLSASKSDLLQAVTRLGKWIRSRPKKMWKGAIPLGIHLEGPYLHPGACGAHAPKTLRPLDLEELEALWKASQGTLKIISLAPERLTATQAKTLKSWAKAKKITLSLGHSKCTEAQAQTAFARQGFSSVTHSWNALSFHHRDPGALGAALGNRRVYVELILDQIHVSPTVMRWTLELHPQTCFVSDCAPAAGTPKGPKWHPFGPLKTRLNAQGVCVLPSGHLAGGGKLLTRAFADWISQNFSQNWKAAIRAQTPHFHHHPLASIGLKPMDLPARRIRWAWTGKQLRILS